VFREERVKSYHDIVGDGGSRVVEQVVEQRGRLARALAGVRCTLAVGSGKGGVGKSTLARQIALAFREQGRRVAVLDADLNGPSQARLAGLQDAPLVPEGERLTLPRDRQGIGVVSLGALIPESEAVEFDSVAHGDTHVWRATREFAFLGQLMSCVDWGEQDYLVVDLPPGAERTFQYAEFLGPGAAFVLVTIPTELSRGVVSRSVAALRRTPNPVLGYVENMAGYACAGCGEVRPLFPEVPADLGIPRLGRVPFDPCLAAPGSDLQPAVRDVAGRIAGALAPEEAAS
jgi:ATP-binding protein involved in chromosome partitioning